MMHRYVTECPKCRCSIQGTVNDFATEWEDMCDTCDYAFPVKVGVNAVFMPPRLVAKPKHPLLNDESKHYEMIGGVQAIEEMEKMFTREELMAWAKLTAMKYRLRIGKKDEPAKEVKKINTYEAYYKYLESRSQS